MPFLTVIFEIYVQKSTGSKKTGGVYEILFQILGPEVWDAHAPGDNVNETL